jgi:hypothetical protein
MEPSPSCAALMGDQPDPVSSASLAEGCYIVVGSVLAIVGSRPAPPLMATETEAQDRGLGQSGGHARGHLAAEKWRFDRVGAGEPDGDTMPNGHLLRQHAEHRRDMFGETGVVDLRRGDRRKCFGDCVGRSARRKSP